MSLNDDAASLSSVSSVGCSYSDPFVGIVCDYAIAPVACLDAEFDAVWEVFEFELGYFGFFLFDDFGCFGEAGSGDPDESKHIINNDNLTVTEIAQSQF